nr:MAG TPA: hypothetical protein [Caudoviricetes sp.]
MHLLPQSQEVGGGLKSMKNFGTTSGGSVA